MWGKEISIDSCRGLDVDYGKESLIELVALGYEFDLDKSGLIFQSQIEYQLADMVYFAKDNGKEVGSISLKIRLNSGNDQFWNNLRTTMIDLADPALLACYIHGIVVHPDYRREGIAQRLLEKMIKEYTPEVILGQTKSPEAVLVRSKILSKCGYRTFYGFCEVTPGFGLDREQEGIDFIKAAFDSEGAVPDQFGVYFVNNQILSPYLPKTDGFPLEIRRAFMPIYVSQNLVGEGRTAVSTLVSVERSRFD